MDLLPMLNSTSGSIDELKAKAQDLGLIMADEMVDAAGNYADSLDTMQRATAAAGCQIAAGSCPPCRLLWRASRSLWRAKRGHGRPL